ncbi:hypothetical protein THOM_1533 [Trachipleistophora hominis]|uniref:Uncharacterized protein n=1 Tax=Trachipleistophora hominis TaxID=72359 RepID=L7JVI1_TRAHO|nr:hypothetical protein THOM_1533 [Trachipleistophora hominis]
MQTSIRQIFAPMRKYLSILKVFVSFIFIASMILNNKAVIKIPLKVVPLSSHYLLALGVTQVMLVIALSMCIVVWTISKRVMMCFVVLQYVFVIALGVASSSVVLLTVQMLLMLSLDFIIYRRERKKAWNITLDTSAQIKMVYMKRAIVSNRMVDLNMGELVQFISKEGEFVCVRKFNGEEFTVHENDVVDNIEDVLS